MSSRLVRWIPLALLAMDAAAQTPIVDAVSTVADDTLAAAIERPFAITDAGTYELTLTDLAIPAALDSVTAAITRGTTVVDTLAGAGTKNFNLDPGSYTLRIVGKPSQTTRTGNVGMSLQNLADSTSVLEDVESIVLASTAVSGNTTLIDTTITLTAAANYTLTLTDFALPETLAALTAAVMPQGGGDPLVNLAAAGSVTFAAAAGDYRLLVAAQASPGASGTFGIEIRPQAGGDAVFGTVRTAGGNAGAAPGIQYEVPLQAAGAYRVRLVDFEFPASLAELHVAAVQNGAVLGSLDAAGSINVTAASGPMQLLVVARPSASDAGLFGIDVAPAGGAVIFEKTQGAGGLFSAQQFTVASSVRHEATLTDIGFPALFTELAAVVTRGTERIGTIIGGGTFQFDATPGSYFINMIATPEEEARAGTYGMQVEEKPESTPSPDPDPSPSSRSGGGGFEWLTLAILALGLIGSKRAAQTTRDAAISAASGASTQANSGKLATAWRLEKPELGGNR